MPRLNSSTVYAAVASENLVRTRADHDRVLSKPPLQLTPVAVPPAAIEIAGHDLDDDDVVARHAVARFPQPVRGRAAVGRQATEPVEQLTSGLRERLLPERRAVVIGE